MVVYRVPVLVYTYQNLSDGKDMAVMKTLPPHTSIISVEEYNEEAVAYRLEPIAEDRLAEAGNPLQLPLRRQPNHQRRRLYPSRVQQRLVRVDGKGNIEKDHYCYQGDREEFE